MSAKTLVADKNTANQLATMSLAELTVEYNKHAAKPLKSILSCSKAKAIEKVLAVLPKATTEAKTEKKEKGPTISSRIVEQLKAGVAPKAVLEVIQKEFKNCKTSMACVYWFKSKINCGAY